jgi:hypothetical protein
MVTHVFAVNVEHKVQMLDAHRVIVRKQMAFITVYAMPKSRDLDLKAFVINRILAGVYMSPSEGTLSLIRVGVMTESQAQA